jgi:hypothetical protein
MDVHNDAIAGAYGAQDHGAEGMSLGSLGTRQGDSAQRIPTLPAKARPLLCVYEAGPCGSWLERDLPQQGYAGEVVAPSLMPPNPGERRTTDRRAAVPLARLARSGALTAV